MATITAVPEGVKVVVPNNWDRSMKVAMASRRGRVAPMTARSAEIFLQLGTPPGERTFLPVGWPKDARSVATLAELRRRDANWTWDKSTKLVWLDGDNLMVAEVADRLEVSAPKVAKPRQAKPAPVVELVAEVPTCSRCSRPSELPTCQPCADSLADDLARRPVNLGGTGGPLAEYLGRLLHEPKRLYALELVAHLTEGAPAPVSSAPWAPKVDSKVRRYLAA